MSAADDITIDELRKLLVAKEQELRDFKTKYQEAMELWDALKMKENQHASQAILIAKVVDFEKGGGPMITASVTDGVDWVDEWGLIASWKAISSSQKEYTTEEDEDG